ncbi:glycosyltransferase family 4 protein [Pedobacter puniceum]|uniref:Glycosyltransferase n=1 Tax=Pedobacter puniceum TaxID=2666136 RepID=A0A7K0FID6_9SPHI|nr:glycosyltransferase family 4 protein [Pedobacter puniceum]MRX45668.1 glycosyltransferase [Pedobacter puniceum]
MPKKLKLQKLNKTHKHILFIHPGIQHTYRTANALAKYFPSNSISLYTWFLLKEDSFFSNLSFLKKRVKPIAKNIKVHHYPCFELLLLLHLKLYKILGIQKGHTPRYQWQVLFAWFLLPMVFRKRKDCILVLTETAAWPIAKFAKKWDIPVIMDFPSISHEAAEDAGIMETPYGKKIKTLERQYIDYGINCSEFAKKTYLGKTSAIKHEAIWLGTDFKELINENFTYNRNILNIACIANTEKRKGLDILLSAFERLEHPNKKLYLIGKISKTWVEDFAKEHGINLKSVIFTGPLSQQSLAIYLKQEDIHLHILPSRFDSFGMVVPETMALGIPNILSPYVGAGEMIHHQKNGYIMEVLDENSLLACILQFLALNDEERFILIKDVKQHAQIMRWDDYDQRIYNFFKPLLS